MKPTIIDADRWHKILIMDIADPNCIPVIDWFENKSSSDAYTHFRIRGPVLIVKFKELDWKDFVVDVAMSCTT